MRKPKVSVKQALQDQRKFVLRELSKDPPTSIRLIAGALDLSTQQVYNIKKALIASEELKP